VNIKYENLCSKPANSMKKIIEFLNLTETNINRFDEFIEPRNLSISKDIKQIKDYIYQRMKLYFSYFKYSKDII
jgi:hypothetical protein